VTYYTKVVHFAKMYPLTEYNAGKTPFSTAQSYCMVSPCPVTGREGSGAVV